MTRRQRPAESGTHKAGGKGSHFITPLWIAFARAGQPVYMPSHSCGSVQRPPRGGLIPRLGNRDAACEAVAAVIRRQRRWHREHPRRLLGHETVARDDFLHAMRLFPAKLNRGGLVFPFKKIQSEWHHTAAEQTHGNAMLLHPAVAHPCIKDGFLAVHPQLDAVLRFDNKLVGACLRRE